MKLQIDKENYLSNLHECSRSDDGRAFIHSEAQAYKFDELSQAEADYYRLGKKLKSVDSLYIKNEDEIYFFEFKNTRKSHMPKKELFYKAHDSIYALQILFFPHISLNDLSEKITYFVVYNNESIEEKENESIHFNKFKEKLKESFREREELPVFWGLDLYEGELYKKIYTLDARQFEEEFLSEIYDA